MPLLVNVQGLSIDLPTADSTFLRVIDGVDLSVGEGEIVGLVGESGSGKTLSALALVRLIPAGARVAARVLEVAGVDVLSADPGALQDLRGNVVGYLFQEPGQALNPVRTIWYQVSEAARLRRHLSRTSSRDLAERLLEEVGLDDSAGIARAYPHQLSGGQRQRASLAAALAGDPRVVVADEPTSALDPIAQERLVELLVGLSRRRGLALLFVSHDLSLVRAIADRVTVVYAGETVESGTREELFAAPRHPYTRALIETLPTPEMKPTPPFAAIQGSPPRDGEWPPGCRFANRCPVAFEPCRQGHPGLAEVSGGQVRCFLHSRQEDDGG